MRYEEFTLEGRNAVIEAYRAGKTIDKLFVLEHCKEGSMNTVLREAKKHDTVINYVKKERLDQMSETGKHQGVIGYLAAYEYATVDEILDKAREKGESPFVILLDDIEDPHNLGENSKPCRSTWRNYSKTSCFRTYCNSCKNISRRIKLYTCCQSNKHFKDNRRIKERGNVVRLRRHGRNNNV